MEYLEIQRSDVIQQDEIQSQEQEEQKPDHDKMQIVMSEEKSL